MSTKSVPTECCPQFESALWHDQIFEWKDKTFIRDTVWTFFYMPLNFGAVIKRIMAKADKSGAKVPDWLCLSDHISKWKMDIYLAVDKPVLDAFNCTLTGKFYSRVYEGPFKNTGIWCTDFKEQAKNRGLEITKWYMWYTTCPKCAKKYGKNYVVVVGEVR